MTNNAVITIIQMGTPPDALRQRLGEPAGWFAQALGLGPDAVRIVRPDQGQALPAVGQFSVAIITGSWSMVTDHEDWSERTADWARDVIRQKAPLLGVCYGHQIMAYAQGGTVDYLAGGREGGALPVTLNAAAQRDPLLRSLPTRFVANLSHAQAVLEAPPGAQVLASSARDPHQILRYHENALSLQFHPEFTPEILAAWLSGHRHRAAAAAAHTPAEPFPATPDARSILLNFVRRHQGGGAGAALQPTGAAQPNASTST